MMRVGIYIGWGLPTPECGGGYTFQETLLHELFSLSSTHEFFVFYKGENSSFKDTESVKFIPLSEFYPKKRDNKIRRFYLKLRRSTEDFFAVRSFGNLLKKALAEYKINLMWFMEPGGVDVDVPYIYTVWDLQHRLQPYFPEVSVTGSTFEQREKHYLATVPKASYVIVGGNIAQEHVNFFYRVPDYRIKVLPFPTPSFALKDWKEISDVKNKFNIQGPYLFYPAQFWPHKNHTVLIKALRKLHDIHGEKLHLVLTGSDKGNRRYIEELVHNYNLEPYVHFLGFISIEDLVALYKQAFALVHPSMFGPYNLPTLEAGGLGCPIIAAGTEGSKEQLGDAAIYFDPRDDDELALLIKTLSDDKALRNELIKKGFDRAKKWTTKDYFNGVIKIINDFEPIRRCWSSNDRYIHL